MTKPNLLFFISDHFRSEALGHMGNSLHATPTLDQFSQTDAVSFSHAFCQNPVCVPSRCSFLSGRYPHVEGFRTMHHLHGQDDLNLLLELKQNGYYIYFGGKNDVFRKDVPLSAYCDYRSNAFLEYDRLRAGLPLDEGYHPILTDCTREQVLQAEEMKRRSRQVGNGRNYYSLFQGVVTSENDLAMGYVGLEQRQIEDAIRFIGSYDKDQPLCVYLSLMLPHPYYACSQEDYDAIDASALCLPIRLSADQRARKPSILEGQRANHRLYKWSDEELKEFKHVYYAMIHRVDHNFGQVMSALKRRELYEDTAVFMFSDHGVYAGEYEIAEINQNTFEDVLCRVPLLIKPPKGISIKPGIRHALVELIDIPATVAALCGYERGEFSFSRSLLPLLKEDQPFRSFVHCEGGRLEEELHCTDGGHSPDNLYWARTSVQEKMPEHTKAVMIRDISYKYVYRLYESDEFYDLRKDPRETENEIENPLYALEIERMRAELLKFMVASCDCVPRRRDER